MRMISCHYRSCYQREHTFIYLEAGPQYGKAPEAIQKKEAVLKKDVIDEKALQEKMLSIDKKVDASPLDSAHKEKVKAELRKVDAEHAAAIGKLNTVTEKSLKAAGEKFQEDLNDFEIRPEMVFLFDTINSSEFKEIQKQQPNIRALEAKVKAAADNYKSHLMANGESAPGHETDLEGHMIAIQELYAGLAPIAQQKEHLTGGDDGQLQTLEKILGEKNNFTLANFKENAAIHGGIESGESKLRIPGSIAELQGRQQIIENNLIRIRSILYRNTGKPQYEAAYAQETKAQQKALSGQAGAAMDALKVTPQEEAIKKQAQEKLAKLGKEFADLQTMRGKDPINAQRGAVDLLQRLQGFLKGYRVGDADQDLQMMELKKSPAIEKSFHDGVKQYLGETENLILDATNNNPSMKEYQQDATSVISNTQPFVSSIETLFKQMQAGKTPSESDMKMFHEDANKILLDPTFNKLGSSDAKQFFGNLKIPDEATSPRLHEAMTKMKDMQDKVSAYMKTLNVLTRQVAAIKGHGIGWEAFLKDAGKYTLITAAAVAGAIAMGALVAASGGALTGVALFAANTAATSLGAAIGSNYMTAAIEGNTDAISTENMATAWAQGAAFSGGGALIGQGLGAALGKGAQQLSQAFNIAPGKILSAPSIKEGIKATGLKGYLQHLASETKEEMFEDTMQKIGEGLAPNDPYLGFIFSLIPFATGKARDILHSAGVERTITDKGIAITYADQKQALAALQKMGAPVQVIEATQSGKPLTITQGGVELSIQPETISEIPHDIQSIARIAGENHFTGEKLTNDESRIRYAKEFLQAKHMGSELAGTLADGRKRYRKVEISPEEAARDRLKILNHNQSLETDGEATSLKKILNKIESTEHIGGLEQWERQYMEESLLKIKKFFPSLGTNGEETLETFDSIVATLPFFEKHKLTEIQIDREKRIDGDFPGSSADVYLAHINGQETEVVAKVYKQGDIQDFMYGLREGADLSLAATAGIGPGFLGYHITEKGEFVVLMNKAEGTPLHGEGSAKDNVTQDTIAAYRNQMKKLHEIGYTFAGDGGQIMVDKNGNLTFIDIILVPLKNGLAVNKPELKGPDGTIEVAEELVSPEENDHYRVKLHRLEEAARMAPQRSPPTTEFVSISQIPAATEIGKKVQREAVIDTNLALDFGNANINMAEAQAKITQKALELIEKGETPRTQFQEDIQYLKNTDPETYELLKKSDLQSLARTECLSAMLNGRKETMTDSNGKKITFYRGKELGKGGVGVVANVAYRLEGETALTFAAIKRPLDPQTDTFQEEVEAGRIVQTWESDHIMKPLHLSENLIIYESGREATDFLKMYNDKDTKAADYFTSLHEMGKGLQEYQKRGMFHGDIKFANVMKLDGKVKIIDNTPVGHSELEDRIIIDNKGQVWLDWPNTGYFSVTGEGMKKTRDILIQKGLFASQINGHLGRAIDVVSYGKMIKESLKRFAPGWESNQDIQNFMDRLSDPLTAGEPGMLEEAMAFMNTLAQTNGGITDITITPAPTFVPQRIAEPSVTKRAPRPPQS